MDRVEDFALDRRAVGGADVVFNVHLHHRLNLRQGDACGFAVGGGRDGDRAQGGRPEYG